MYIFYRTWFLNFLPVRPPPSNKRSPISHTTHPQTRNPHFNQRKKQYPEKINGEHKPSKEHTYADGMLHTKQRNNGTRKKTYYT